MGHLMAPPGVLAGHGLPLCGGDAVARLPQRLGREGQATTEGGHAADHFRVGGQGATCRGLLAPWRWRSQGEGV